MPGSFHILMRVQANLISAGLLSVAMHMALVAFFAAPLPEQVTAPSAPQQLSVYLAQAAISAAAPVVPPPPKTSTPPNHTATPPKPAPLRQPRPDWFAALPRDPHDAYLPKTALTTGPVISSDVLLEDRPAWQTVTGSAVLVLYINEQGQVDDIGIQRNNLPDDVVQSAIEQFRHAQFQPGQLHEQTEKSRIRIEINYQNGFVA